MDLMSMEASLYVTSLARSSAVPSRPHVSLRPHGGEAVDGWADPLLGSSSMSVRGSLPRCEAVVSVVDPLVDNVFGPSILSKKSGYVAVRVDPPAYKSRLEVCKFSLIARVVLSSGKKPWKFVDLKAKLPSVWKLNSVWRLISVGVFRLQPWIPNFNPALQKSSNAQVWVRFYDLSWVYRHPNIISDIARGIGVPLRLDRAIMEGDFGHFTCVLVDIDVSIVPPSSLLLERDDFHSSFILVEYENLPALCSIVPPLPFSQCLSLEQVWQWDSGSDTVLGKVSSTSLVASPGFTSLMVPTTSVVTAQVCRPEQGGGSDDSLTDVLVASTHPVVSTIFSDSVSLTASREQHSGSVNAIPIVSRSLAVVTVSNILVVHDSPVDIGSDLSVDLSAAQAFSFSGSGMILESSNTLGLVFDVHSIVPNQTVPVIDSLVQTVPTIVGSFSLRRPPFSHAAHGVRNVSFGSSQISSSVAGAHFTWARGRYPRIRVERRLDRALVSEGCISCWRDISCVALPRRFLDHCPLMIQLSDIENVSPRPFRFQSMWLDHPDFMALVRRI
ncbi:hypothetical protein Dsin_017418 [Dipteronia sinensis]|uniref:DUF4283 domain-containing protein n=1 Tax=Dipteronia sinensis TaxID=43782 RepID=A0AAE0AG77_9ROSI|nr:hypothetical protein Dsin_017418 [Dipteronia sinensis]